MRAYSIYFAGDLFDHKHLIGNKLLATAIEKTSNQQYICMLPQEHEQVDARKQSVRDQDLELIMVCDLALFNFDGPDLDSGTAVEFLFAKLLDIPSVILRTDFRAGGDQAQNADAWNLMCSFYPRTETIQTNAMALYQEVAQNHDEIEPLIEDYYDNVSRLVVEKMDMVRQQAPVEMPAKTDMEMVYRWASQFPGESFAKRFSPEKIKNLLELKRDKGLV